MKTTPPAHPLFDILIRENNLRNDAELCRVLELHPADVSKIRHGAMGLSDRVRLKVLRTFHWTVKRMDEVMPPARAAE